MEELYRIAERHILRKKLLEFGTCTLDVGTEGGERTRTFTMKGKNYILHEYNGDLMDCGEKEG